MKTVLLADDSSLALEIISPLIQRSGYRLLTATDGNQAVAVCCEQHPDLILMDLYMPNLDGFSATRTLREKGINTPIVAITGSEKDNDRVKAKQAGCNDYIMKTLEMKEVATVLDHYLYEPGVFN